MKQYKKTLFGSIIAFFIGTSCCWLSSLTIWIGGATFMGMFVHFIEDVQVLLIGLGIVLLMSTLFLYLKMKKEKKSILKRIGEFFFGERIIVKSDFFGDMLDAEDYYECRRMFKPTNKIVEIGLEKTEDGSNEKQISFFKWLEDNYDLIIRSISPSIEKRAAGWIPNYRIENFKKEFILEYFYIPKCDKEIIDWEISFFADNEIQHWCSLEMSGTEVKHILIDG